MLRNTKESDETFYETSAKLLRNILFVRTLPAERIPASFRFALVGNRYTIGRSRYRSCGGAFSVDGMERILASPVGGAKVAVALPGGSGQRR